MDPLTRMASHMRGEIMPIVDGRRSHARIRPSVRSTGLAIAHLHVVCGRIETAHIAIHSRDRDATTAVLARVPAGLLE